MTKKITQSILFIARRAIVIYVVLFALFYVSIDKPLAIRKAINHARPESFTLLFRGNEGGDFQLKEIKPYYNYYFRMAKMMPELSSAHGMLGFCQYHMGQKHQAIRSFKKAIEINPYFFWYYYNLGVIYFQMGEYESAIEQLEIAIQKNPEVSIRYLATTKVYKPLLSTFLGKDMMKEKMNEVIFNRYEQGYQMLVLSHYKLKSYSEVMRYAKTALNPNFKNHDFFYYYAGLASMDAGLFDQAESLLASCLKANPHHADAAFYLAQSHKARGNKEQYNKLSGIAKLLRSNPNYQSTDLESLFVVIF